MTGRAGYPPLVVPIKKKDGGYLRIMKEKVEKIIQDIRPTLQADGGDVEIVDVDPKTGIVKLRLKGACAGCPMSQYTLKLGIEAHLKKKIPGVKEVVSV